MSDHQSWRMRSSPWAVSVARGVGEGVAVVSGGGVDVGRGTEVAVKLPVAFSASL